MAGLFAQSTLRFAVAHLSLLVCLRFTVAIVVVGMVGAWAAHALELAFGQQGALVGPVGEGEASTALDEGGLVSADDHLGTFTKHAQASQGGALS